MLPSGNYAVTLSQLRDLAFPSVSQNNALRELKASCGKDFQILKSATELNNRPQWIVTIDQLNYCLTELAFRGHQEARELVRLLSGLSLQQLFSDAFGQKFEAEDRQAWLQSRTSGKYSRRDLTDAIKAYCDRHPEMSANARKWIYKNATDRIYLQTHGRQAKKLVEVIGCDKQHLRDNLTRQELTALLSVEDTAIRLVDDEDMHPTEAIVSATERVLVVGRFAALHLPAAETR